LREDYNEQNKLDVMRELLRIVDPALAIARALAAQPQ